MVGQGLEMDWLLCTFALQKQGKTVKQLEIYFSLKQIFILKAKGVHLKRVALESSVLKRMLVLQLLLLLPVVLPLTYNSDGHATSVFHFKDPLYLYLVQLKVHFALGAKVTAITSLALSALEAMVTEIKSPGNRNSCVHFKVSLYLKVCFVLEAVAHRNQILHVQYFRIRETICTQHTHTHTQRLRLI